MGVVALPVKYRRPRVIKGREIWASPEPSDLMVWEVCPYIARHNGLEEGCQGCPEWEEAGEPCLVEGCEDPDHGKIKRGCRAMAEEACRVMMAVQRIE